LQASRYVVQCQKKATPAPLECACWQHHPHSPPSCTPLFAPCPLRIGHSRRLLCHTECRRLPAGCTTYSLAGNLHTLKHTHTHGTTSCAGHQLIREGGEGHHKTHTAAHNTHAHAHTPEGAVMAHMPHGQPGSSRLVQQLTPPSPCDQAYAASKQDRHATCALPRLVNSRSTPKQTATQHSMQQITCFTRGHLVTQTVPVTPPPPTRCTPSCNRSRYITPPPPP
jgi:hypothetical protein